MDGVLIVDKPQGMTSHDVVDFIRKHFGLKKVGHAGTLDPMATGVLVILIGRYTKSSNIFSSDNKEYHAEITLGADSDTGDAWGALTPRRTELKVSQDEVRAVFKKFLGTIEQVPPAYSAVKYKGRKLYEFARKGIKVRVDPRKVTIEKLEIINISLPKISFVINCSKGTYVRSLASDIGEALRCGAYLSSLKRTFSGRFGIDSAVSMDELKNIKAIDLKERLLSL